MPAVERAGGWRELAAAVFGFTPLDLAARMTLIYFMVRPLGPWWASVTAVLLASTALLVPALARRPVLWFVLALAVASWVIPAWSFMDNHGFLLVYWCAALGCSLAMGEQSEAVLATNARWLLGLAFALAALWKVVLAPDFLDGTFFRATLLADGRFRQLSLLAGGMTPETYQHNVEQLHRLGLGRLGLTAVQLVEPHRQVVLAYVSTWWTALVETSLGVLFLLPRRLRVTRWGDPLLIFFCWFTYPFATVAGFGWLLTILGIAQLEPHRRWVRALYLATFAFILIDKLVPWTQALVDVLQ
jgi:hypothetical protein